MTGSDNPTRRTLLQGIAGASTAATLSIAGCTQIEGFGGGGDSSTLEFWSSPNEEEVSFHESAAEEFTADNDIELEVRPVPEGDSSEEVVLSALASGTEPDAFANVFPGFAAQLEVNDAAVNLYDIEGAKQALTERCGEEILSRYETPDGDLYQAPWKANPVLFQYNDTVFEEAGYEEEDYPRTLDALVEAGIEIVDSGAAEVLWDRAPLPTWYERWFDFLPIYFAASEGKAEMFTQNGETTEPAFNNDTAVTVLQFFQDLFESDLLPTQSSENPKFPENKAAINTGGPWVVPYFEDVNEDVRMSHHTAPVPDDVEPNAHTYADPKNTTVFQSSSNAEAVWSFTAFELGEDWDVRLLEDTLQLPHREGIIDSASSFFEENPDIKPYAEALETSHPPSYTPDYTKVMDIFGDEAFVPVVRGNRSPEKGLNAAEQKITEELE
ncbi:extracellular solute-binding protein [Halegenticoccus tardaugens]|uniref:extracellular solute-binding protein n=1 Tax=Halegenticoccus tardaugens TaxID=2071624 RepID=UPI00100AFBEA|nr:extracellular solute-binding protein [Halegenticoccus tardaugens]